MTIHDIFLLCGGLAFFLFGMNIMSAGLEKMAGGKLEATLNSMTSSKVKGLMLGAGVTAVLQSSSAVTVMLVGLVNSGVMELRNAVSIVMGSNIGTTMTSWLLSLSGIESDNVYIRMLKPSSFSPILAAIGVGMLLFAKKGKLRETGSTITGFAVLMYGMTMMSGSVSGLAEIPLFSEIIVMFENPLMGVLVGIIITGIIQSSSASVGLLQALTLTGSLSYGMAIPIIMGQNIGTCVTALISSIGTSRNAKRVAVVHILFNVIGTTIFLLLFLGFEVIFGTALTDTKIDVVGIAVCHSAFNILATAMLFPFGNLLAKLAVLIIPDGKKDEKKILIDERLLESPSIAVIECRRAVTDMASFAREAVSEATLLLEDYSVQKYEQIIKLEQETDRYEDELGAFLVKLTSKDMSAETSVDAAMLLHSIGDIERLGDHALNMAEVARENHEKQQSFSDSAFTDIKVLLAALGEILDISFEALDKNDAVLAASVEPLEELIDNLTFEVKTRHIDRLQRGECTIALGFTLNDLMTDIERASDHCSNIAMSVIQSVNNMLTGHSYEKEVKAGGSGFLSEKYDEFSKKYQLS